MIRTATRSHVSTTDGVRLAVQVLPPATTSRGAAVVIAHGFSATKDDARVAAVATAVSGAGCTVVTYDARGHGGSGGETTLGVRERHDVAAVVAIAREHASRVVLVGASMGAIAVLGHAAGVPSSLSGVVTVSAPARWRLPRNARGVLAALIVQTRLGRSVAWSRLGVRVAPRIDRGTEPAELARAVGCPVAVIHGTEDPFIATSDAARIHRNLHGPSQLVLVDGLGHAFDPADAVTPAILDAIDWVLVH